MNLFFIDIPSSKRILSEAVSDDNKVTDEKIADAIRHNKMVSILYNENINDANPEDPSTIGRSWRYICPVVYGELSKKTSNGRKRVSNGQPSGKYAIRAWQSSGSVGKNQELGTNRGLKPRWKTFRLDRILAWYNQDKTFDPSTFSPRLKTEGDKDFASIKCHAPQINIGSQPETKPETKGDVNNFEPSKINPAKMSDAEKVDAIQQNSVDNVQATPYNNVTQIGKIEAPSTKPVSKNDIEPQQNVSDDDEARNNINKIEGEPTEPMYEPMSLDNNPLTNTFKDMNQRWDNLNNDEDEED